MFKIVPVVTLNADDYKKSTRPHYYETVQALGEPGSIEKFKVTEDYDSYWKNCLADSGIYGLTRYQGPVRHRTDWDLHNYRKAGVKP